jgi:hypothetical protein
MAAEDFSATYMVAENRSALSSAEIENTEISNPHLETDNEPAHRQSGS